MTKNLLASGLGYSGLIPFLATGYLLVTGGILPGWSIDQLFVSYSAVILAFLGGSLWGRGMAINDSPLACMVLAASNLIALLVWFNMVLGGFSQKAAILGLAFGFLLVLILELYLSSRLLAEQGVDYKSDYLRLRVNLTFIVILVHTIVFLFGS